MEQSSPSESRQYPAAPWPMHGSLWLTLFRLPVTVDAARPAGLYGAAFVSYTAPSPLTYSELLVARPVRTRDHGRRVSITDIWVDSSPSVAGGRELWAIPKELCTFTHDEEAHRGPAVTTGWTATLAGSGIAAARFHDVSSAAPRLPFRGGTWQPGIDDTGGEERTATLQGSSRTLPCRATWELDPDGPLAWLRPARQLGSVRMADFRMSFG